MKEKAGPKIPDFETCIAKRDYVGAITLLEFNRQNAPKVGRVNIFLQISLQHVYIQDAISYSAEVKVNCPYLILSSSFVASECSSVMDSSTLDQVVSAIICNT